MLSMPDANVHSEAERARGRRTRLSSAARACAPAIVALAFQGIAATSEARRPSIEQMLSPAFPYGLVAARAADRIAWIENERGARNVYTAAAPDFAPVQLTSAANDDGVDLRLLQISSDGAVVAFIRGHAPGIGRWIEMPGWVANPGLDPDGGRTEIWAASTRGNQAPGRVAAADNFALSPDGRWVLYVRDGQIHRAAVDPDERASEDRASEDEDPLFRDFGVNGSPVWSPDGRRIAYVSVRDDHSFVAVYDLASRRIVYLAPGVDRDSAPAWSPDGSRVAFLREPGLPTASWAPVPAGTPRDALPRGLIESTLPGGYAQAIWVADPVTGEGSALWRNSNPAFPLDPERIRWAGEHVVFEAEPDGWRHWYAIPMEAPHAEPVLLTPGEGMVEQVALSPDGEWLYYTANIGDPDRRQLWRASVRGGVPERLTSAPGIATFPAVPGSGEHVAVLAAGARQPLSVALLPAAGGEGRVIAPRLAEDFPAARHVEPEAVVIEADDGVQSHGQLFRPPDAAPGERGPALVFVHGGPRQQTLLGYHYQAPHGFYHLAYGLSQYFANRGYLVLSVNYRGGIGYGRDFRLAAEQGEEGNSEYRDILAAGRWLRARADVDPEKIGIWGLSYGGMLTAQALARDSDLFSAGVAIGGFHLWGYSLDPESVAWRASPVAAIEGWRSPVLLVHGDDDRNVDFSYTVGLVQLLREQDIPHELIVYPNETHYFLVWGHWIHAFTAMDDFFERTLLAPRATERGRE